MIGKRRQGRRNESLPGKILNSLPVCKLIYPRYEARHLQVKCMEYARANIPEALDGMKIVYLTDFHYGFYLDDAALSAVMKTVTGFAPDLILMGGDYADNPETTERFAELFPESNARYGAFGVLGNHDWFGDETRRDMWLQRMEEKKVRILRNASAVIRVGDCRLQVSGVEDCYTGEPDTGEIEREAADADYTLFLSHSPDYIADRYAESGETPFFQLALCGHTHGGQVTVCGWAPRSSSDFGSRYLSGWFAFSGSDMLVSNGIGMSWLPVRLGAPPQAIVLTLRHEKL